MRWLAIVVLLASFAECAGGAAPVSDGDNTLTVLSNNVGIFPEAVTATYPENVKEKKKNIIKDEQQRAEMLAAALLAFDGDPDVILLQEIWSIKARDVLIEKLAEKYPHCRHPESISDGTTTIQAAGLVIFSKYPLRDFAFEEFTRGIGIDKVARKGIAGVKLTKAGRTVAVFNTHLQAGGKRDPSVKPDQLRQGNTFIREFTAGEERPIVVLAGDFNVPSNEADEYEQVFELLEGARDSYRAELGPVRQTGRNKKHPTKRIDYLLTFGDVQAESTIVDPAGDRVADHFAVYGTISLD